MIGGFEANLSGKKKKGLKATSLGELRSNYQNILNVTPSVEDGSKKEFYAVKIRQERRLS